MTASQFIDRCNSLEIALFATPKGTIKYRAKSQDLITAKFIGILKSYKHELIPLLPKEWDQNQATLPGEAPVVDFGVDIDPNGELARMGAEADEELEQFLYNILVKANRDSGLGKMPVFDSKVDAGIKFDFGTVFNPGGSYLKFLSDYRQAQEQLESSDISSTGKVWAQSRADQAGERMDTIAIWWHFYQR